MSKNAGLPKTEQITITNEEKEVVLRGLELFSREVMNAAKAAEKTGSRGKKAFEMLQAIATVELDALKTKFL